MEVWKNAESFWNLLCYNDISYYYSPKDEGIRKSRIKCVDVEIDHTGLLFKLNVLICYFIWITFGES